MKKLFVAIRSGKLDIVKELIEKKPDLIFCTAKQPPKKDDGQSPLQVAIKSGNFVIANYLIDRGADINFIEHESCNKWKMPVLHDAIRASIMNSRFLYNDFNGGWEIRSSHSNFKAAFNILKKLIDLRVEIKCYDSYGNSVIGRAILDARQILPKYHYQDPTWKDPKPLNTELVEDLTEVFRLLIISGGNVNEIDEKLGESYINFYRKESIYRFLDLNN